MVSDQMIQGIGRARPEHLMISRQSHACGLTDRGAVFGGQRQAAQIDRQRLCRLSIIVARPLHQKGCGRRFVPCAKLNNLDPAQRLAPRGGEDMGALRTKISQYLWVFDIVEDDQSIALAIAKPVERGCHRLFWRRLFCRQFHPQGEGVQRGLNAFACLCQYPPADREAAFCILRMRKGERQHGLADPAQPPHRLLIDCSIAARQAGG